MFGQLGNDRPPYTEVIFVSAQNGVCGRHQCPLVAVGLNRYAVEGVELRTEEKI